MRRVSLPRPLLIPMWTARTTTQVVRARSGFKVHEKKKIFAPTEAGVHPLSTKSTTVNKMNEADMADAEAVDGGPGGSRRRLPVRIQPH